MQVEKYNEEMKGEIALNRRATCRPPPPHSTTDVAPHFTTDFAY